MEENIVDLAPAKKAFTRVGLALSAMLLICFILQTLWVSLPGEDSWMTSSSWGMWLGSFLPQYLVAMPACLLIMGTLPAHAPRQIKLGTKNFLVFLPICFCVMYAGNILGNLLSGLLSGGQAENALLDFVMDTNPLKILVIVILAPLLEEYVFRKQLIDRTVVYGEKIAVLLSAVTFGLMHQNLFQFFYAFGLGLIFAYIYTRTGHVRYTVIFHAIINFMGSVIAPWILSKMDLEAMNAMDPNASAEELTALYAEILPGMLLFLVYALALVGLSIAGLVLLIIKCKQLVWKNTDAQLPKGTSFRTVYLNWGMGLFVALCVIFMVIALFI